ncbi:MAG: hypothetical protein U0640_13940 [Phycisphaerales bacterium]
MDAIHADQGDRVLLGSWLSSSNVEVRVLSMKLNGEPVGIDALPQPWQPRMRWALAQSWSSDNLPNLNWLRDDVEWLHAPTKPGKYELTLEVEVRLLPYTELGVVELAKKAIRANEPWRSTLTCSFEVVEGPTVSPKTDQAEFAKRVNAARMHPWPRYPFRNGDSRFLDRTESVACRVLAEHSDGTLTDIGLWTEFGREGYLMSCSEESAAVRLEREGGIVALIFVSDIDAAERTLDMRVMIQGDRVRVPIDRTGQ